jgi:hypothetical protein
VEYFDFYLLHNVYENSVHVYEDPRWGIVDYFIEQKKRGRIILNCTPFVRQYDILSNKWGVLLCQKEYQTNDIRQNSKNW